MFQNMSILTLFFSCSLYDVRMSRDTVFLVRETDTRPHSFLHFLIAMLPKRIQSGSIAHSTQKIIGAWLDGSIDVLPNILLVDGICV